MGKALTGKLSCTQTSLVIIDNDIFLKKVFSGNKLHFNSLTGMWSNIIKYIYDVSGVLLQVFLPKLKEQMLKSKKKASEETAVNERSHIPEEGTDVDEGFKKSEAECRIKETVHNIEEESQFREGVSHLEDGIATTRDVVFSVEVGTEAKEDLSLEVGTEIIEAVNSLGNEAEASEAVSCLGNEAVVKEAVNSLKDGANAKERVNSSDKGAQSSVTINDGEGGTKVNEKGPYSGEETHL